jgi:integrase
MSVKHLAGKWGTTPYISRIFNGLRPSRSCRWCRLAVHCKSTLAGHAVTRVSKFGGPAETTRSLASHDRPNQFGQGPVPSMSIDRTKYLDRINGRTYLRRGRKRYRLPDEGTPEFDAAYDAAMGCLARKSRQPTNRGHQPGTIAWFVEKYLASDWFVGRDGRAPTFSKGTQLNYRPALGAICALIGPARLSDLDPDAVDMYLAKVTREHSPSVAALHKILLSNLWKFARGFAEFKRHGRTNPTADAINIYRVEQEHEPWPDDVQDRFLAACDANLYLAFHLLLCTGQRVSDVVKMKWADFDGERFKLVQQKTETPLWIKAPRKLLDLLARTEHVHDNVLTHKWGRPYTRDSLGHRIKEVLIDNGDGRYTTHGLRKSAGIMLAENQATVPMIMAALGHTTPKLALYYCRLAQQRTLNDQAVAIMDQVFDRQDAERQAAVEARRGQIRRVK